MVRSDLSLYGLNRVIQVLMGWEDCHLHQFKIHGCVYAVQWSEQRHYHHGEPLREIRLADLGLRVRQKLSYDYDFGDFWEHEVRIEARLPVDPNIRCPICLDGARSGPPEDSGGPRAYTELLNRFLMWQIDKEDWLLQSVQKLLNRKDGDGTEGDAEFEGDFSDEGDDERFGEFDPERFDRNDINQSLDRLNAALTRSTKPD
ncbi:MAG: plasmid pRiA4b ORF-3 family protein [Casimicrobium sp.]